MKSWAVPPKKWHRALWRSDVPKYLAAFTLVLCLWYQCSVAPSRRRLPRERATSELHVKDFDMTCWIRKQGNVRKNWKERFLVLCDGIVSSHTAIISPKTYAEELKQK